MIFLFQKISNSLSYFFKYTSFWGGICFLLLFAFLDFVKLGIPNAPAFLMTTLIYIAFQNGLIPASIFAILSWGYTAIHFSIPGHLFYYERENLIRVISFAFLFPVNAYMVGVLKNKLMEKIRDEKIMREQVLTSAKLSALGEMAGGIAHEINNPLTIISAKCQVLFRMAQNELISSELILKTADEINQTVKRMSKIIKGLKSFARDASYDTMEIASVKDIIDSTLAFCQEKFTFSNITLKYDPQIGSDFLIECRPTEISQVLLNLLNNAGDAVENKDSKWVEILVSADETTVRISIIDSGDGVPLDMRNKIMLPFFTTKEPGKGTGLGLSISLGIVNAHSGKLYLDENYANTCFVIELPRYRKWT